MRRVTDPLSLAAGVMIACGLLLAPLACTADQKDAAAADLAKANDVVVAVNRATTNPVVEVVAAAVPAAAGATATVQLLTGGLSLLIGAIGGALTTAARKQREVDAANASADIHVSSLGQVSNLIEQGHAVANDPNVQQAVQTLPGTVSSLVAAAKAVPAEVRSLAKLAKAAL